MVQEVQQQGNWYQTPNEIQGIGDTRRRVREHTQVTPSFGYQATFHSDIALSVQSGPGDSSLNEGTFTMTSSRGDTKFQITNGCIRIPLAGAYSMSITIRGGASGTFTIYHYIKNGSKTIYQTSTAANTESGATKVEVIENFGRYNLIEYWAKLHFSGSGIGNSTGRVTITLKKL